jgi:hypothetical protein
MALLQAADNVSESAEAPNPICTTICVIFVVLIGYAIKVANDHNKAARARDAEEDTFANSRVEAMRSADLLQLEALIIAFLYKHLGGEPISTLSHEIGESSRVTAKLLQRLVDTGDVFVVPPEPSSITNELNGEQAAYDAPQPVGTESIVKLTDAGCVRYQRLPMEVKVSVEHGDVNIAYPNANITSKSTVLGSYNVLAATYSEDTAAALLQLEEAVKLSRNPQAAEELEAFVAQAQSDKPNRVVMRALFDALQKSAPAIMSMTNVVVKIKDAFF